MRIPLYIEIDDTDTDQCSTCCPFFNHDSCKLFDVDLEDVVLQDGQSWQDEHQIPKTRDIDCRIHFSTNS